MKPTNQTLLSCAMALIIGTAFGLVVLSFVETPVITPPPIKHPTPAVSIDERDLVVGLSEILVDINREATATRKELEAVKREARQIISAMVQEIQRLQRRPTLKPGDKTVETMPELVPNS